MASDPTDTQRTQSRVWNILKVLVAISLAYFVVSKTGPDELVAMWHQVSIPWLFATAGVFFALAWCQARRYWIIMGHRTSFRDLFALVIVQTVVGNLFATAAGAASYVLGLRTRYQVQLGHSITSLVLARLGDLFYSMAFFLLSSLMLWPRIRDFHWLVWMLGTVTVCVASLGLIAFVFRERLVALLENLAHKSGLHRVQTLARAFAEVLVSANKKPGDWLNRLFSVAVYSLICFTLSLAFFYGSLRILSVHVSILVSVFIVSLTQLIMIAPIHVFGGLGVTDITTMYLLGAFGVQESELAALVIALRVVFYMMNLPLLLYLPIDALLTRRKNCERCD